jgi:GT2 family glycosyltransferase
MTHQPETVCVVVVTYNSDRLLPDLLTSLESGLAGLPWHLTVADNASADGTVATLARLAPQARIVEMGRNAGYSAGINAAVAAAAPHTLVLVLNPDIRLAPGSGQEMVRVLTSTDAGIVVPRLRHRDGTFAHVLRREPSVLRAFGDALLGARRAGRFPILGEIVTSERDYQAESAADWATGAAMLISPTCWRACAPWDESFFLYSEETDFALRARDAGFVTRLAPTAIAFHLGGQSQQSPALWALLTSNRYRLFRRRHRLPATAAYWSALVLRESSRAALGSPTSRAAVRLLLSPRRLRETPGPHSLHR